MVARASSSPEEALSESSALLLGPRTVIIFFGIERRVLTRLPPVNGKNGRDPIFLEACLALLGRRELVYC